MNNSKRIRVETALSQLKLAVSDLFEVYDKVENDLFLFGCLKAQNMDVKKSEKMIRELVKWRLDRGYDKWTTEEMHPEILKIVGPHKSRCKNGTLFTYSDVGKADSRKLIELFGKEQTYKYFIQSILHDEQATVGPYEQKSSSSTSKSPEAIHYEGNVLVLDVKNVSYKQLASVKALQMSKQVAHDYGTYFPALGSTIIIINCHTMILPFVNIMKKLVSNMTIEVYDSNVEKWREAILKRVDLDQLPQIFHSKS